MTQVPDESPLHALIPPAIDAPPADIIILTVDQWEEFRTERRSDRRVRFVQSVLLALAVAAVLFLVREAYYEQRARREVSGANQIILRNIEDQTSPERQAEQQAAVKAIVLTVDCNGRAAIEEALNEVSRQRPEVFGPVVITDNCPKGAAP